VDRHQRIEGECQDAESRGPDPASPLSHSHSVVPANRVFIQDYLNRTVEFLTRN
jgi:hypothetical protein